MRRVLLVVVIGIVSASGAEAQRPPIKPATVVSGGSWSGFWAEKKTSSLLRLEQMQASLTGDYLPPGDKAVLCRFKGTVEGNTAKFDVTLKGKRWHCSLERKGNTATLYGQRDTKQLLEEYGGDDGRLSNGTLILIPRDAKTRKEDEEKLKAKRQEILKGLKPEVLGVFEKQ